MVASAAANSRTQFTHGPKDHWQIPTRVVTGKECGEANPSPECRPISTTTPLTTPELPRLSITTTRHPPNPQCPASTPQQPTSSPPSSPSSNPSTHTTPKLLSPTRNAQPATAAARSPSPHPLHPMTPTTQSQPASAPSSTNPSAATASTPSRTGRPSTGRTSRPLPPSPPHFTPRRRNNGPPSRTTTA